MRINGKSGERFLAATSLIAVMTLAAPAFAQTAEADPEVAYDGDIVVTAQKREQRLNDVGLSISAVTGDTLRERNVLDVAQLEQLAPNLSIAQPNGPGNQPAISLRGVGLNDFNSNNNGPIAVYADEVYRSSIVGQNFVLFDVNRVEVVKGPQGTLFGRNATGGAVRVISNRPESAFSAFGSASYASFDTSRFDATINLPISDNIAFRAAGVTTRSDGYIRNVADGTRAAGYDYTSWRAQLLLEPSSSFDVLLSAEGAHVRNGAAGFTFQGLLDATGARCPNAAILSGACGNALGYTGENGFFETNANTIGSTRRDSYLLSGVATLDLGSVTITSVTGYEDVNSVKLEDTDSSPLSILDVQFGVKSQTFSQELRGSYTSDTTNATFGAFYLTENLVQDQTADVFRELRPLLISIAPVGFPGGFNPTGAVTGAPTLFARFNNDQDTETFALFGQVEQNLTERLRLIGGLRYTNERRDFLTIATLEEPGFAVPLYTTPLRVRSSNVTFKAGLEFRPQDNQLLYASVSTGFKSGGFNGGFLLDPAQVVPFRDERLTAYEAGAKLTLFDRLLQFNAAAFYYDYSDIQVFSFINSGNLPVTILSNAGDARIYGFEAEATLRPAEGLSVNASLGLIDTKFTRFTVDPTLGGADFTGNRLALAPAMSLSGSISYERPISSNLSMRGSVDGSYQSRIFFDPSNDPLLSQPGYALVNASLSVGAQDDRWRLTGFARNLFDRRYISYAIDFSSFGFNQRVTGVPQQFGIQLDVRF
ncbi:TonB-dependent receptor [Hyphomonas sp. CACIAM 19H1]|uniref:TonB-dependent receptor n=1 Tax=Hyphomonas sp. CACIAM 19H1 TaxID=1873716 RepID=UPI0013B05252|nr:TonB-dependent receptor [Hyphomonas sp. CACIAM 19H1]